MKYVAQASVKMVYKLNNPSDQWSIITNENGITRKWRTLGNHILQVIAGCYDNDAEALVAAKQMYVNLIFNVIDEDYPIETAGCEYGYNLRMLPDSNSTHPKEAFFYWDDYKDENKRKGSIGVGVYAVENSISEFDNYEFQDNELEISASVSSYINFECINNASIEYTEDVQKGFSKLVLASNVYGCNKQMELYCNILEAIAPKLDKSKDVVAEIDALIDHVNASSLPKADKNQLCTYLENGKSQSIKLRILKLVEDHGEQEYSNVSAKKIITDAYKLRSEVAHKGIDVPSHLSGAEYMKDLVVDVLKKYYGKERTTLYK